MVPGPCGADRSFADGEQPAMSPPDALGSGALAVDDSSAPVVQADGVSGTSRTHYGKAYAVPVRDVVRSSGWLAEALYRAFEILVALLGLTLALPLMLVEALLIGLDSRGPVLFFHQRPGRSIIVHGRDLE